MSAATSVRSFPKKDPIRRDWWAQPMLIEVNASGQVTRCEPKYVDRFAPPQFACQCDVLRGIDFGRGADGRRASFNLWTTEVTAGSAHSTDLYRSAYLKDTAADDPTALLGSQELPAGVEDCLHAVKQPVEVDVPVRFTVAADGRVHTADPRWPALLPPTVTECMDAALAKARFTCPLSGQAHVNASLSISVRPYRRAGRLSSQ